MTDTASTVPLHVVVLGSSNCGYCTKMNNTIEQMRPAIVQGNGAVTTIDTSQWNGGTPTTLFFMPDGSVHTVPGAMDTAKFATIMAEKLEKATEVSAAGASVSGGARPRRRILREESSSSSKDAEEHEDEDDSDNASTESVVDESVAFPYYDQSVVSTGRNTPFVQGAVKATSTAIQSYGWKLTDCSLLDLSVSDASSVNHPSQASEKWAQLVVLNKSFGKALVVKGSLGQGDSTDEIMPTTEGFSEVRNLSTTTTTTHKPIMRLVGKELGIECAL